MNLKNPRACRLLLGAACLVLLLVAQSFATSFAIGTRQQDVNAPDVYAIDNAHTSVVFAVSHFGLSYTYGRFNECSGEFEMNSGELATKGFTFSIKADSIDTNHEERDNHLKGPDFFDAQQFPEISFVTTGFEKVDGVYQVTGDLTMLGQSQPLTMPVSLVGIGKGPFGQQRAGFFTKFTIKRSDFGMDKMQGQIGDNISITFSFEGIKK